MKKLYQAVDRFCATHPRFGIPNLMRVIVLGTAAVYVLQLLTYAKNPQALEFLTLSLAGLQRLELWRLVTFIFVPTGRSPLWLVVSLYFYYWMGSTLESRWGTARFNLYYFSGVVLTILSAVGASLIAGNPYLYVAGTEYINLSMILAFAVLFPDVTVYLVFLPIKMKWLAMLDGVLFLGQVVMALMAGSIGGALLPLVALLNFFVFVWPEVRRFAEKKQYQHSPQTVQFKKAVKQQQQTRGYHHKCSVCGKTDTDYPDLQFRYCSKCAGYHCFCEEHIFSHVHFTEE